VNWAGLNLEKKTEVRVNYASTELPARVLPYIFVRMIFSNVDLQKVGSGIELDSTGIAPLASELVHFNFMFFKNMISKFM